MLRRTFLRWVGAASVAAAVSLPQFGLQARALDSSEPLQPKERVQKFLFSPVLEELEKWNLHRTGVGGFLHDFNTSSHGTPVFSEATGRLVGWAPTRKFAGSAYRLKTRRELLVAFGGVQDVFG